MPPGGDSAPALPKTEFTPPTDISEARQRWEGASKRFAQLVELGHPDVETLRAWIPPLRQALDRGMIPSVDVEVGKPPEQVDLAAAAFVFGDIVQTWCFSPGWGDLPGLTQLRDHIRNPSVYSESTNPNLGLPLLYVLEAGEGFDYVFRVSRLRRLYFAREHLEEEKNLIGITDLATLDLQFSFLRGFHHADRNFHTIDFHKALVEGLMYTQFAALVRGGEPGGPFFPDGSDRGEHHWKLLKPVFRFGGPLHRKSNANLLPANPNLDLGTSFWAVADNGRDSVDVLVHNPPLRNGREAVLELPLPWSGPTRVTHSRAKSEWSRSTSADVVTSSQILEAKPFAHGGVALTNTAFRSWFKLPLTLEGMHLLELAPASTPEPLRTINAPETVGFGGLRHTNDLFRVGRSPPPPWWGRSTAIRNSAGSWRFYGPASVRVSVDATRGDSPDWKALRGFQPAEAGVFPDASPLADKSVRITFPGDPNTVTFVAGEFHRNTMEHATMIGLWVRAHRPSAPAEATGPARPPETHARFYLGKLPLRQRIELEFDTWYFLSSPADTWRSDYYPERHFLHVWSDPASPQPPELEINTVDAYRFAPLGADPKVENPTLGFVREQSDGRLTFLVLGVPGTKGVWRQRLDRLVDPTSLERVVDEGLRVTAESPEDPPPEDVATTLRMLETARVLEMEIEILPPAPSSAFLEAIAVDFPLIAQRLKAGGMGAVLWREKATVPATGDKNP